MKKICLILSILFTFSAFAIEATLVKFSGDVTVDGAQVKKSGVKLKIGSTLIAKDEKSYFIVQYNNGTKFIVKNGELIIGLLKDKEVDVNLVRGLFTVVVKKTKDQKFSVKTKNAVMGVRGTKFGVSETDIDSYICVCEGSVEVSNSKTTQIISRNQDAHIQKDQEFSVTTASEMMWNMSVANFKDLGVEVEPLN